MRIIGGLEMFDENEAEKMFEDYRKKKSEGFEVKIEKIKVFGRPKFILTWEKRINDVI